MSDTIRLKHLCSQWGEYGLNIPAERYADDGLRLLRTTDITERGNLTPPDAGVYVRPQDADGLVLEDGDVLLSRSGTLGRCLVYSSERHGPCTFAGYLVRFRVRQGYDPRFVYYCSLSHFFRDQLALESIQSTIANFNAEKYGNLPLFHLSDDQQRRISDFLDAETARIDHLVDREVRLVELLHERLDAAIVSLVTSGLRSSSGTRDSGIEPLGPIPTHWRPARNKTFMREITDLSLTGDEELLTVSHITGVTPRADKEVNMFLAESFEGYKRVAPGDLVINTMWAWMGALGVSKHSGIVSPAYGVYRADSLQANPAYLDALFRSRPYVTEMTRHSRGVWTSRLRLYPDAFLSLSAPLPPLDEQREIAGAILELRQEHDRITSRLERAIELLEERRQAVITAAVTGELDLSVAA